MNGETLMRESKGYQLLTERITKEITIEHILVVLKRSSLQNLWMP